MTKNKKYCGNCDPCKKDPPDPPVSPPVSPPVGNSDEYYYFEGAECWCGVDPARMYTPCETQFKLIKNHPIYSRSDILSAGAVKIWTWGGLEMCVENIVEITEVETSYEVAIDNVTRVFNNCDSCEYYTGNGGSGSGGGSGGSSGGGGGSGGGNGKNKYGDLSCECDKKLIGEINSENNLKEKSSTTLIEEDCWKCVPFSSLPSTKDMAWLVNCSYLLLPLVSNEYYETESECIQNMRDAFIDSETADFYINNGFCACVESERIRWLPENQINGYYCTNDFSNIAIDLTTGIPIGMNPEEQYPDEPSCLNACSSTYPSLDQCHDGFSNFTTVESISCNLEILGDCDTEECTIEKSFKIKKGNTYVVEVETDSVDASNHNNHWWEIEFVENATNNNATDLCIEIQYDIDPITGLPLYNETTVWSCGGSIENVFQTKQECLNNCEGGSTGSTPWNIGTKYRTNCKKDSPDPVDPPPNPVDPLPDPVDPLPDPVEPPSWPPNQSDKPLGACCKYSPMGAPYFWNCFDATTEEDCAQIDRSGSYYPEIYHKWHGPNTACAVDYTAPNWCGGGAWSGDQFGCATLEGCGENVININNSSWIPPL